MSALIDFSPTTPTSTPTGQGALAFPSAAADQPTRGPRAATDQPDAGVPTPRRAATPARRAAAASAKATGEPVAVSAIPDASDGPAAPARRSRPVAGSTRSGSSDAAQPARKSRAGESKSAAEPSPRPPATSASGAVRHRPGSASSLAHVNAGSAAGLVRQARAGVAEAQHEPDAAQRFATAYLAALRAAAAMLALRGRPHRGRARPTSAWVLLTKLAPELSEWAAFFASGSATRAAILAGMTRNVSHRTADDLVRQAAQFTDLIADAVAGRDPDHVRD